MGKKKLDEKGMPYGAREKMPFWYSLAWSSRGVVYAINAVFVGYIVFFCTDVLGLNAGIIGGILLGSKVIDAFTDLGFGYLVDRTHTRFGKARPYEFFVILEWLFTILMFAVPDVSRTFQYIWVFIMFVLVNAVCQTALGGVDSVYMSRAFTTDKNRIKVMSINGFVIYIGSMIFSILMPQFLSRGGTTQIGWVKLSIMLGVPLAAIGMLRFIFCKEIATEEPAVETDKKDKITVKETVSSIGKNKFLFIIVGLMFLTNIVNNMSTATTYYFKYIIGNTDLMSIIGMTGMVSLIGLIAFPILASKFGTTKILHISIMIGIIGILIRIIGATDIKTIVIGSICMTLATMPISVMINTYLIDCMDYGEWKTGTRIEGLVASIANFASKIGAGAASGFIGLITGLSGYDGTAAVQTASANTAIVFLFNWFPLILFVIMLVLAMMYQVDKLRPQMKADLEAKGK